MVSRGGDIEREGMNDRSNRSERQDNRGSVHNDQT